ncbi:MAG: iron ABC transporter permease [Gemmatimonadota bacterium]
MPSPTSHQRRTLLILGIAAVVACVVGVFVGPVGYSPGEVIRALLDPAAPDAGIIRGLRLPRAALGFAVGGSLAVAGATLQAVVGNPLAEPWLLGLSGGASLGAVIGIVIGLPPGWSVAIMATVGALIAIALVYRVALVAGRRLDTRVLLLAGVVVGAFAGAVSAALLAIADPFTFRAAALWLFGGFSGAEWHATLRFVAIATPALVAIGWLGRGLDLLALGDETAAALGADVTRVRRYAVLATAVLTAATVSVAGVIGFVGLVVPHAVRWRTGPLHGRLFPAVFLAGGAFTVLADTVARTVLGGQELPVGVITALVGVPIFAVLLRRSAA